MNQKPVGVAVLGFGNVGSQVVRIIEKSAEDLTARTIDLGGKTVVPGLTDSHCHIFGIGERELTLNLEGTNTLEDFLNLERFCAPHGTVLFHDCLPLNELTAARHRQTRFWTGDVWRILPALARYRPDLSLAVVECAPSGLAIVRGLNPKASHPLAHYEEAVRFGHSVPFETVHETIMV